MEQVGDESDPGDGVDAGSMSMVCDRVGPRVVMVLTGDLDLVGGDAVEAAVAGLVADGVEQVWVRAEGVGFMDSSGLGGLLAARAKVVEAGGVFRFGSATDAVARVIELAGVGDLLGPTAV